MRVKYAISIAFISSIVESAFSKSAGQGLERTCGNTQHCYTKAKSAPELQRGMHDTLNLPNASVDKNATGFV